MSPNLRFRALLPVALTALTLAVVVACGGSTSGSSGSTGRVKPGAVCSQEGLQAGALDGCNTCTCTHGGWACTEMACARRDGGSPIGTDAGLPVQCQPGAVRSAGDGCNTCTCSSQGTWLCTRTACAVCTEGATKNDVCNSCTCAGGQWACTDRACPPPLCTDGQTKQESCNTCTCAGGQWGCTKMACPPPPLDAGPAQKTCGGFLGSTCSATEYCAYTEGQLCGGADASSVCLPRPSVCDTIYAPVCGCDGKTYSSDCTAAAAGTGVLHAGVCP